MELSDTKGYWVYSRMEYNYRYENHEEFIRYFKKYRDVYGFGVTKLLIYKYIYALIETNQIAEAYETLKGVLTSKIFSEQDPIADRKLYLIGRKLYDKKYYDIAKFVLDSYLELNENADHKYIKSANNWLQEIKRHKNGEFNKVYADVYLEDDRNKIEPGMIVYLKYTTNIELKDRCNIHAISYLVWKVEGDKIYAFPIVLANNSINYFYINENDVPRCLSTEIITFKPSDINSIYRKLNSDKLKEILEKQYYRFCHDSSKNEFTLEYEKNFNVNKYDIIATKKPQERQNYFIITEIDQQNRIYKVNELLLENGSFIGINNISTDISFDKFIYEHIAFENFFNTYKNKLFDENSMETSIDFKRNYFMLIEYKGTKYKVLDLIDDNYVCVIEPNNNYSKVIYINKYEDIKFIKMLDLKQEIENIKHFIIDILMQKSNNISPKLEKNK